MGIRFDEVSQSLAASPFMNVTQRVKTPVKVMRNELAFDEFIQCL